MSLSPAQRLGPYEIVARLGAGAMGEVYRARDTRLARDVAIKILPADVAHDAGRRGRFEQEARAVAALNHPNILGLYDIGTDNDTAYIVTELVLGEPLEALIERGPVPTRKLLDLAVQIADGMAAAHTAHITHRDLKPANIMVSAEGRVKILDFGLAKQTVSAAAPDETLTVAQTTPGMILGTINYMSPEQARGKPTDHRSDQFSFGLVLYEMASGKKAFGRPEAVQTMSAILSEEAPPIQRNIPSPLRWTIDRCLAKDPADRYDSSRDLFQDLRSIRDHLSQSSTANEAVAAPAPRRKMRIPWQAAAAFVLGAVLATFLFRGSPQMADQSAYRFTPFSFLPDGQGGALWSPDGKAVAYSARVGGVYQIFLRYLDQPTPVQLTRSKADTSIRAWTPDGRRLLIDTASDPAALWSLATVGGDPELMAPKFPDSRNSTISSDNKSAAFFYPEEGRYGVWIKSPLDAKPVRYVPDPFATKDVYNTPGLKFSPDGKWLLLFVNADRSSEEAWLLPYPADPKHPPRRILWDLESYGGTPGFCWMPDSRRIMVAVDSARDAVEQLWIADVISGNRQALTSGTTPRTAPSVSPDGQKVIFAESRGNFDIVSVDLATAAVRPLIATERDENMPAWAAKQPALAYVTNRNGPPEIWLHNSAGDRPLVTARDFPEEHTQWFMAPALSPEADRVIYTKINQGTGTGNRLWISAVTGGAPIQLTNDSTVSGEFAGSWSLDGSWYTYLAFRGGQASLMKVKASGQATPAAIKGNVDFDNNGVPSWSPDGKWIVLGETLYSSDGQTVHPLGKHHADGYAFSADGKLLYGTRSEGDRELLFSVDAVTGAEKVIGSFGHEFRPASNLNPAVRLSLAPDGKSLAWGAVKGRDNLWMLEGFAPKRSFWSFWSGH